MILEEIRAVEDYITKAETAMAQVADMLSKISKDELEKELAKRGLSLKKVIDINSNFKSNIEKKKYKSSKENESIFYKA